MTYPGHTSGDNKGEIRWSWELDEIINYLASQIRIQWKKALWNKEYFCALEIETKKRERKVLIIWFNVSLNLTIHVQKKCPKAEWTAKYLARSGLNV